MADRSMGGWTSFYIVAPVAIVLAALITHLVYETNEKKLKIILERENQNS
jgi:Na+/melibiose symporter-like transporter